MADKVDFHPSRIRLLFVILPLILVANFIVLLVVEGLSVVEAIYFIVITITTVGYGDITPTSDITRFFIVMLIISFLSSVAIFSESFISRIIEGNKEDRLLLKETIDLEDHVIIMGNHRVSLILAEIITQRQMPVVFLSASEERLLEVRQLEITSYLLDGRDPFPYLNVNRARALYFALRNDEETIKYSVQVKHINPDLKIYALTEKHMKENYFKYLNMNSSFTLERILGTFLSNIITQTDITSVTTQLESDAKYIIFNIKDDPQKYFERYRLLDILPNEIHQLGHPRCIAVPRAEAIRALPISTQRQPDQVGTDYEIDYNNIIFCGYTELVRELLSYMTIPLENVIVFTFSPEEKEDAEVDGFVVYQVNQEEFPKLTSQIIEDNDLILNFMETLSDSLYTNSVLLECSKEIEIVQLIFDNFEAEIFEKMGVHQLIHPFILTTRDMFQELLREMKLTYSVISPSTHIFEMIIDRDHPFYKKSSIDLVTAGFDILLVKKVNASEFEISKEIHMILEEGDSLIVKRDLTM